MVKFGVLNSASIALLNLSLGFNSVGFYQMTKLSIIPVTVGLQMTYFNKKFSAGVKMSLLVLLLGVGGVDGDGCAAQRDGERRRGVIRGHHGVRADIDRIDATKASSQLDAAAMRVGTVDGDDAHDPSPARGRRPQRRATSSSRATPTTSSSSPSSRAVSPSR